MQRAKRGGIPHQRRAAEPALAEVASCSASSAILPAAAARRRWGASTTGAYREEVSARDAAASCASATSSRRSTSRRASRPVPREAEGPAAGSRNEYNLSHPDRGAAGNATTAAQLEEAAARAQGRLRARKERISRAPRFAYSNQPDGARRAARSGARPEILTVLGTGHAGLQAGRHQRAAAHAPGLPHRQARTQVRSAAGRSCSRSHGTSCWKTTEIGTTRRSSSELRTIRERIVRAIFAGGRQAVSPGSGSGPRRRPRLDRGEARSCRSSSRCCGAQPDEISPAVPRSDRLAHRAAAGRRSYNTEDGGASKLRRCSCARARPTRRPGSGCGGCATRRMSRRRSEEPVAGALPRLVLTSASGRRRPRACAQLAAARLRRRAGLPRRPAVIGDRARRQKTRAHDVRTRRRATRIGRDSWYARLALALGHPRSRVGSTWANAPYVVAQVDRARPVLGGRFDAMVTAPVRERDQRRRHRRSPATPNLAARSHACAR